MPQVTRCILKLDCRQVKKSKSDEGARRVQTLRLPLKSPSLVPDIVSMESHCEPCSTPSEMFELIAHSIWNSDDATNFTSLPISSLSCPHIHLPGFPLPTHTVFKHIHDFRITGSSGWQNSPTRTTQLKTRLDAAVAMRVYSISAGQTLH